MANHKTSAFSLTAAESSLRQLLLDVAEHINPEKPSDLRFTGGWVRDKLMGIGSHDIDVGIDDMTGYQFGLRMKEYLAMPNNESKYGAEGVAANLHKIEANPEKSKHLETVTTKIFGLDVDFVNLRKETYTEESRNPQMEFGTPQEDALRRDATINAMFYNLNTQKVEDFTGQGHDDMRDHIIRTPLEPFQTFKDDPLRVLRLIRFASRFEYAIDPEAEKAMGDKSIRHALRLKISRERVGVEIEKTLKGPHPLVGLQMIDTLGLYDTIFTDPEHELDFKPDVGNWDVAYSKAENIIDQSQSAFAALFDGVDDQPYLVWILSSVVPWFDAPIPSPAKPGSRQPPPPAFEVIRNGLKASMKICDVVRESVINANEIIQVKDACLKHLRESRGLSESGTPAGRDTLGMTLRKWGLSYKSQLLFACMLEAVRAARVERDVTKEYITFIKHLEQLDLLDAPNFKPVVDGKMLAKELNTKPGPWMKSALDEVMTWQLIHPKDATPEAAVEAIRSKHGELPSCLVVHFLTLTIRPLFSQTKTQSQAETTSQGRRAINANSNAKSRTFHEYETSEESSRRRPWKELKNADSLQLLDWCLKALQVEPKRTEQNWPLVIPPVLAMVDDIDVKFKAHGCKLLTALLKATPPELLTKTGLGQVFQDAITPCLSYLPSLTPENESIEMLDAAYPAVILLSTVRQPKANDKRDPSNLQKRERLLTHILHHHFLRGIALVEANDHPRLMACIVRHLASLMQELSLGTVGQLTHIIPAINSVLGCELGRHAADILAEAARCYQRLIAESWPRVWRWRGEILKGVCLAWLQTEHESKDELSKSQQESLSTAQVELRKVVQMLKSAIDATKVAGGETDIDFAAELKEVAGADPKLASMVPASQ